jgi:hypothetical protein
VALGRGAREAGTGIGFQLADEGQALAAEKSSKDAKADSEKVYLLVRTVDEVRQDPKQHPLNVVYYLEHQLCKPLLRVLPEGEKDLLLASVQEVKARSQGISSVGTVATMGETDSSIVHAGSDHLVGGKKALELLLASAPQRKRRRELKQEPAAAVPTIKPTYSRPKIAASLDKFSCLVQGSCAQGQ